MLCLLLLAIKRNEIMPLAATRVALEITTLCSNTEKDKHDITFTSKFKNYINEFIYKTETDS